MCALSLTMCSICSYIHSHQSITMCAFSVCICSTWSPLTNLSPCVHSTVSPCLPSQPVHYELTPMAGTGPPPPPHPQSTVPKDCRLPSPSPVKNIAEITANMLQKHSLLSKIPQPSTYYSSSAIFPIDNLTCVWNGKLLHFPRKNCWPPLHI